MTKPNNMLRMLAGLPLLLLAFSFSSALVLTGICSIIALALTVAQALLPTRIAPALRDTLLLLVAAASGGSADMLMAAFAPVFVSALHAYLPLAIFSVFGFMVSHSQTAPTWRESLRAFSIIILVLLATGFMRELIGTGTAFDHLALLMSDKSNDWSLHLTNHHRGILLTLMPCTMLIVIGILLAARNHFRKSGTTPPSDAKIRRVRVTGAIS